MNNGALLSLVRVNQLTDTAVNDYAVAAPDAQQRDAIMLVDPDGAPCATPRPPRVRSEDYPYRYITAAKGLQVRQLSRDLSIFVDYIDGAIAARLEQWQHERALVYVCPNFGRRSIFSWRPFAQAATLFSAGGIATDLLGTKNTNLTQNAGVLLWDYATGLFAPEPATDSLVFYYERNWLTDSISQLHQH